MVKIKETGETVELIYVEYCYQGICSYINDNGELCHISNDKLLYIQSSTEANTINWEQRRYEIAKDILVAHNANSYEDKQDWGRVNMTDNALLQADYLIEQLINTKIPDLVEESCKSEWKQIDANTPYGVDLLVKGGEMRSEVPFVEKEYQVAHVRRTRNEEEWEVQNTSYYSVWVKNPTHYLEIK